MISVVSVFNDRAVFHAMLGASLAVQREPFQLVAIDNTGGAYRSAASALNAGARQASGDYLLFAHQDVRFSSPSWLGDAERLLRGLPDLGVAGVAGARAGPPGERVIVSNIEDSDPPQRDQHVGLSAPEPVETVDECAFFVPRAVFERLPLDDRTCDGWHLYAVDYSLSARERGLRAYALPLALYHRSGGAVVRFMGYATFEGAYFRALGRVLRKHGERVVTVPTTCGTWSARRSLLLQRFPPRLVARAVGQWMDRSLKRDR